MATVASPRCRDTQSRSYLSNSPPSHPREYKRTNSVSIEPAAHKSQHNRIPNVGKNTALIVVDMQNDFISGSLAVTDALPLVGKINGLIQSGHFECIAFTRDCHPQNHISFASSHEGNTPFTTISLPHPTDPTLPRRTQELWPDHCVQFTKGFELHAELDTSSADIIIDKGTDVHHDSYSGFEMSPEDEIPKLAAFLHSRGIVTVYVCGLAYDFCVGSTCVDAVAHGFDCYLLTEFTKKICDDSSARMLQRMQHAGVCFIDDQNLM